jgi:hypothetical protein
MEERDESLRVKALIGLETILHGRKQFMQVQGYELEFYQCLLQGLL